MIDDNLENIERHCRMSEISIPETSDKRKHYLTTKDYRRISDRIAKERYDDLGAPID